ncbi:MAG: DUF5777 family beta-barrel protein [Bacteroidetes bacterium]|nr:DUF5777 family beta-barrel protein [Bacteroidota bacterium]
MKKLIADIVIFFSGISFLVAQETTEPAKTEDKPVRSPFESGILIDNQTCVIPSAKTLEFLLEHRFGTMQNGMEDFFGIWGGANIRLGLNYSITNFLMVGAGTSKNYRLQDIRWKWDIIKQTRSGRIPVFVTYFGNITMDARNKSEFGDNYKFTNRLSYFTELIVTRKFHDRFILQVSGSFSHINKVEQGLEHDKIGISFGGRIKITPQSSFIFNYDIPLNTTKIAENDPMYKPYQNFGVAWEISTSTHCFQFTFSSANSLSRQYNFLFNDNDWTDWSNGCPLMIGLNLTRLWNF